MNRRKLIGLLATSASLAGCSSSVASRSLMTAIERSFGSSSAFDPDYPEKLPYASIAVSSKNNQRALLVLAKVVESELHWMSSDRGVLVTENGRLIRTVGLPENIARTEFLGKDFLEKGQPPSPDAVLTKRLVDMTPGNRYGTLIESTLIRGNIESTQIHRRIYGTTHFIEKCIAHQLSWEFTNHFWIDDKGMCWRSIQHTTPGTPPLEIELTKPFKTVA